MKIVQDVCIEDEILESYFVCDLNACQGRCCTEENEIGIGAPLDEEEVDNLLNVYAQVRYLLSPEGIQVIEEKGVFVEYQGRKYTTTIQNRACVFTIFDEKGTAKCAIEQAYKEGKTDFYKPISCHLYPIKVKQYNFGDFIIEALYYHHWNICTAACGLGQSLQVPLYVFLKEALVRKFGKEWYEALLAVIENPNPDAQ